MSDEYNPARPCANCAIYAIVALLVLMAIAIVLVESGQFRKAKESSRRQFVTAGLLDFGEKGKVLKHLSLVYPVRIDGGMRVDEVQVERAEVLFRRKRESGEYVYLANPGNTRRLPSTRAVDREGMDSGLPLLSVAIDPAGLSDPETGIAANPLRRGMEWERRATASFVRDGQLRFAANVGLRVHGGDGDRRYRVNVADQSYRIYFRPLYGVRSLAKGAVFDEPTVVRRLVVHKGQLFETELVFDMARRMGVTTPLYTTAVFYLNGERMGLRTLTEQLSKPQWQARRGEDHLFFFRARSSVDDRSRQAYASLVEWYLKNKDTMDMQTAAQVIDVHDLTRGLILTMFTGTSVDDGAAAVLSGGQPDARWTWAYWTLPGHLGNRPDGSGRRAWERESLAQVVIPVQETRRWRPAGTDLRSVLFTALMNRDPAYREYFLHTVTKVLNHELTRAFFSERFAAYDATLARGAEFVSARDRSQYERIKEFFRHRADRFLASVVRGFERAGYDTGGTHTVSFTDRDPGRATSIDGHATANGYTGRYFHGQRIRIGGSGEESGRWSVNGERMVGDALSIMVTSDTRIERLL
jgi:hypothetical protein